MAVRLPSGLICLTVDTANQGTRIHIEQDLDPYICVFDPCDSPLEIYSSRQEWLAHMSTRHRSEWICLSSDHKQVPWKSNNPDSLQSHLLECHPGAFHPDQLPVVVQASQSFIRPLFQQCPFCPEFEVGGLEDHIVGHLRTFALRSLPCHADGSDFGSLASSLSTATHTHTSSQMSNPEVSRTISDSRQPHLAQFLPKWTLEDAQDNGAPQDNAVPDVSDNTLSSLEHYHRLGFRRASGISNATISYLVRELPVPVLAPAAYSMDAISQLEDKPLFTIASKVLSPERRQAYKAKAAAVRMYVFWTHPDLGQIFYHLIPTCGDV